MTQREFNSELKTWLEQATEKARKRLEKLQAAAKGSRTMRRVRVKGHMVPEHEVRSHYRWI